MCRKGKSKLGGTLKTPLQIILNSFKGKERTGDLQGKAGDVEAAPAAEGLGVDGVVVAAGMGGVEVEDVSRKVPQLSTHGVKPRKK